MGAGGGGHPAADRRRHIAGLAGQRLENALDHLDHVVAPFAQVAVLNGVELGERPAEGAAHLFLGIQQLFAGAPERGRGHFTTARAIYRQTGDLIGEWRSTAALGLSYFMDDERARARELLRAGAPLAPENAIVMVPPGTYRAEVSFAGEVVPHEVAVARANLSLRLRRR